MEENALPRLRLPKRYEILKEEARKAGLDPREFVERVEKDAKRVDSLLNGIRGSGCGQIEWFLGLSGSGKTTFVSTLPKFFDGVEVYSFDRGRPLEELADFVIETAKKSAPHRIVLVEDRDNPKDADLSSAREAFDDLRRVFRQAEGAALVLWPVTDKEAAQALAARAWDVGRDSVVAPETRGLHSFEGLSSDRFYDIADVTSRNLSGDGLEAFGITRDTAEAMLIEEETITGFYSKLEAEADRVRGNTLSVLKQRVRPQIWVVLPGDNVSTIDGTVSTLTQGTRSRVDVDLLGEFIDNPQTDALYIAEWKKRRGKLAHIMRALDVRLIGLPPNVALAAIRAFGEESTRSLLKKPSANLATAKDALRKSRLYKAILEEAGIPTTPFGGNRKVAEETENEYRRVQVHAGKSDVLLNRALGKLIEATLEEDEVAAEVIVEKQDLPGSKLKPDVQVRLQGGSFICIEPTWRSTDAGILDELKGGQNTLRPAHIKKYLLDKVSEYVKDLDL